MTTKFTFDINDLNIPWSAGGSYTVSIGAGFAKEVGNNRSPSEARPNIFSLTVNRPTITGGNTLGATNIFSATSQTLIYDSVVSANAGVKNLYLYRNGTPDQLIATIANNSSRYSFDAATKKITLDLSNLLNGDESYYLTMDAAFVNNVFNLGSAAITNESITFSTGARPAIASSAPINDSINNYTSTVQLNYNRAVNLNAGNYYLLRNADNLLLSTVSTSSTQLNKLDADSIRLNFLNIIDGETNYHIRSDADIVKDQFNFTNRAITDDSVVSFGTGLKPFVVSTFPSNENNFVMTTTFSLIFNNPIVKHESGGNIYVYRDSTPDYVFKTIPVSSSTVSVSGSIMTVADNWSFNKGETYYVTFDANIVRDPYGFTNVAQTSESFMKFTMADVISTSSFIFQSTGAGDQLGTSIAMCDNFMVVGARELSTQTGRVIAFDVRSGATLVEVAPAGATGFGFAVSAAPAVDTAAPNAPFTQPEADTTYVIIGAPFSNTSSGLVQSYDLALGGFSNGNGINNPGAVGDQFGYAVAGSVSHCLIGAPGYSSDRGRVYNYNSGGRPVVGGTVQTLTGEYTNDRFGAALQCIDDGVALGRNYNWQAGYFIIGAPGVSTVYVYKFEHAEEGGTPTITLDRTIEGDGIGFGSSISRDGNNILIGEPNSNAAYVFNFKTGALVRKFTALNTGDFGTSVALKGNFAAIGAPNDLQFGDQGKVYYYNITTGEMVYVFRNPNVFGVNNGEKFGQSVAFESRYDLFNLAIGAPFEDYSVSSTSTGVVYLYQDPELYQRPTVVVSGTTSSLWQYQTDTVTFTVSEPVSDFTIGDIYSAGFTLTNFTGTGAVYTVDVDALTDATSGFVAIRSQKFSNSSGYNVDGTDANNIQNYIVNRQPTFTLSANTTQLQQYSTATITITAERGTLDITTSTFESYGTGVVSNVQYNPASGDPVNGYKIWTADFTATVAPSGGNCQLWVMEGAFTDAVYGSEFRGTTYPAFEFILFTVGSLTVYWDTAQDTGVLGDRKTNANPILIKGTAPSGQGFTVSVGGYSFNQSSSGMSRTDGYNYTLSTTLLGNGSFTPSASSNGYTTVSDSAFTIDRTVPTFTLALSTSTINYLGTATLTITASEPIVDLSIANNLTFSGGTITDLQGAGTTYTAILTNTETAYGTQLRNVQLFKNPVFGPRDLAGNIGPSGTVIKDVYTYRQPPTPPTMTITSSQVDFYSKTTATVTFTANEAITGFDITDITVYGGTLSNFVPVSSTVYTVNFTPLSSGVYGYGSITVAANKYVDNQGTFNSASASITFNYFAYWA